MYKRWDDIKRCYTYSRNDEATSLRSAFFICSLAVRTSEKIDCLNKMTISVRKHGNPQSIPQKGENGGLISNPPNGCRDASLSQISSRRKNLTTLLSAIPKGRGKSALSGSISSFPTSFQRATVSLESLVL